MEKHNLVKEVEMLIVARKIRFLGLIILFGVFLIFASGIFVSSTNINPHLEYLNISTFVFCLACCGFSVLLKKLLLKKVTNEKFEASYFNATLYSFNSGIYCRHISDSKVQYYFKCKANSGR